MADAPPNLQRILRIQVPVTVVLAEKEMTLQEVSTLSPGSVIEFDRHYQHHLELRVNNRHVARGETITIREKFGLRVREVGPLQETIRNLGAF